MRFNVGDEVKILPKSCKDPFHGVVTSVGTYLGDNVYEVKVPAMDRKLHFYDYDLEAVDEDNKSAVSSDNS